MAQSGRFVVFAQMSACDPKPPCLTVSPSILARADEVFE
ncbi:hypothetical protein M2191_001102 [Bradyrhizobium japonicum]|nr:hypothetical protein [Bradyrhizobium japonicum]